MTAPKKTTVELSVSTMRALATFRKAAALLRTDDEAQYVEASRRIERDAYTLAARLARDVDAQARRDAKAAASAPKVCAACSTPITSPWSRAKFCSPRCASRARHRKARAPRHTGKVAEARRLWRLGERDEKVIAAEVGWGKRTDLVRAAVGGAR